MLGVWNPFLGSVDMVVDRFVVPAGAARAELVVVNSRFIACAAPATSVEMARAFINQIKDEYPDATHHVPAFIIGHAASVTSHCSDDGEPSGTAGRPVLAVLAGSGVGDIVVVVVRYFGGTKLGTGGLVRAYTEATQRMMLELPRALKVSTTTLRFELAYSQLTGARRLVKEHEGKILDEDFKENIWMTAQFITDRVAGFQAGLSDFSRGSIQLEVLEVNPESIFPQSAADGGSTASPKNGAGRKK